MNEELKPCPFCGGQAIEDWSDAWEHSKYGAVQDVHIECEDCHAETLNYQGCDGSGLMTYEQARTKAVEAWNRRV